MSGAPRWRWGDSLSPLRRILERGGMLAVPTESSYGLAIDPTNHDAVAAVFSLKRREARKPLPVILGKVSQARRLGLDLDRPGLAPLIALWPAPLTLVVPLRRPLAATAGALSVAVRVPAHRRLCELLLALGSGLTATSANRSGETPLTDPLAVAALLKGVDAAVVDDGPLPGGEPSTIIDIRGDMPRLLRRGAFPVEMLADLIELGPAGAQGPQ